LRTPGNRARSYADAARRRAASWMRHPSHGTKRLS
jgi:hypothetical protein